MSLHISSPQQILTTALSVFNQYGNALTPDQLAARLAVSANNLPFYFDSKAELVRQLVNFTLTRIRKPPADLFYLSPVEQLRVLLTTYSESFTAFSQIALLDLKRHYPEEWSRIRELRESQWQRIATTIETNAASNRLRPVNPHLFRMLAEGMLLDPFLQEHLSLPELLDLLLLGIARRVS